MKTLEVSRQSIIRYVNSGLLKPAIKSRRYWVFTDTEVERFLRESWAHLHPGPGKKGSRRG